MCDSPLRCELVRDELALTAGQLSLPARAGLGIEVDEEAVLRYGVD